MLGELEIMMCKFIAMQNMSFPATYNLSSLLHDMFPDSAIASDFSCKHTKTRSILCEALDPHYIIENIHPDVS